MNRVKAFGLPLAFAAGLAFGPESQGQTPDSKPAQSESKSWLGRLIGRGEKPSQSNELPKSAQLPESGQSIVRPPSYGPLSPETLADALKAEQEAYLRRMDVCTRLRALASDNDDETLLARADRLEQQATALYHQRVSRLGVKGNLRGRFESEIQTVSSESRIAEKLGDSTDPRANSATGQGAPTKPVASSNNTQRGVR